MLHTDDRSFPITLELCVAYVSCAQYSILEITRTTDFAAFMRDQATRSKKFDQIVSWIRSSTYLRRVSTK